MSKPTTKQRRGKARAIIPYTNPIGRPKKLNPDIQKVIIETILEGNTRGCAAARAGISYPTFCNWMNRGEAVEDAPNPTDEDKEYFAFYDFVTRAEAEAHAQSVKNIVGQGRKNFQAAAWWLERRFDKEWNKPERREITNPDGSMAPRVMIYIPEAKRITSETIEVRSNGNGKPTVKFPAKQPAK